MNTKERRIVLKCALFAWIAAASSASAEAPLESVVRGTPHQSLFALRFDGDSGIAVGADGELQTTQDGGKTWKQERTPTQSSLMTASVNGSKRLIAGQMGEIFIDEGNDKWVRAVSNTTERLLGSSMNANGVALVVGSFGTMLRSTDYGKTWQSVAPEWRSLLGGSEEMADDFAPQIYSVVLDNQGTALAVGELSLVLRSVDGGATWQQVLGGVAEGQQRPPTLFDVTLGADGIGYAVGQAGLILQTTDRGHSWCSISAGTHANLFSVASLGGGRTVISGMRQMLISRNGGHSWEPVIGEDLAVAWYSGTAVSGASAVMVVGQSGNILRVTP